MADRFECDKCHTMFPSPGDKKGRFLLEEVGGVWTDHPGRAAYKHESFICHACFVTLKNAIHRPHKAPQPALRSVGQPTPQEYCQDCGAVVRADLSCTPGCAGMQGLAEAKRIGRDTELETAMGLLMAALSQARKVMVYGLNERIETWLAAMRAKGHTALDDEPE